jgi:hypothetical protein
MSKAETFPVQLPESDGGAAPSKSFPRKFTVQLRKTGVLLTSEIIKFLNNKPHDESIRFTGHQTRYCGLITAIQALDILCRHKSSMELFTHKSSFYTPKLSQVIGAGVEVWYALHRIILISLGREFSNLSVPEWVTRDLPV